MHELDRSLSAAVPAEVFTRPERLRTARAALFPCGGLQRRQEGNNQDQQGEEKTGEEPEQNMPALRGGNDAPDDPGDYLKQNEAAHRVLCLQQGKGFFMKCLISCGKQTC